MSLIEKIPNIPQEILTSIKNENLCFFIGAGLSMLVGCPSWKELSDNIVDLCSSFDLITDQENHGLKKENNLKRVITKCYKVLEKDKKLNEYYTLVYHLCQGDPFKVNSHNAYDELLKFHSLYISTNFDIIFARKFLSDRVYYQIEDFNSENIYNDALYQIHGSLNNPKSIVLTEPDYIEKYKNEKLIELLKEVFINYTVLFINYGLGEYEILDFLFEKIGGTYKHHYTLKPYKIQNYNNLHLDEYYYDALNIKLIPYDIGDSNYNQIYDILTYWNTQIKMEVPFLLNTMKRIDEWVD